MSIYEKLYDITYKNLEDAGEDPVFSKDAFLYASKRDLKYVNVFDMTNFDNESLLQVLYIAFFYRTPEESARINWGKLFNLPESDFQRRAFKALSSSQEYLNNGTIIYNNFYSNPTAKNHVGTLPESQGNPYIEKLYCLYRKMPLCIKRTIKMILGGK